MEIIQQYGAPQPRPVVRFEMRSVETRSGNSINYVDVPWAIVSAPGSRDTVEKTVSEWLASLVDHAKAGRVPADWPQQYDEAFEAWKKTQEQPTGGASLRNWPAISPAQLQGCLAAGITSIEELASANEQTLQRLGMGAVALKNSAQAWLKDQTSSGALAIEVQTLTNRLNAALATIEELKTRVPAAEQKA